MNDSTTRQPTLRVNSSPYGPGSISACCLGPDVIAFLASCTQPGELLKSIFRVTVAQALPPDVDSLPDVSGRYLLLENEVQFTPHFPFESGLKYRVKFDPRRLGAPLTEEPLTLDFVIPRGQEARAPTTVTQIFPSCDLLPENLLRFYICFSNSMRRGRALEEISLLASDGQPVADALYRPPVELWDKAMRRLTVLLDPGRLKRWVGPNVELGAPLKAGQQYTLQVGSGMMDRYGRRLGESFRKEFFVGNSVRERIAVDSWKVLVPIRGSREAVTLMFSNPLDWALLLRTITIRSGDGSVIKGEVVVDQCERRWSFTPTSPWVAGVHQIHIGSGLEDVCGNSITGPFDRPLRKDPQLVPEINRSSFLFQLI